ncbi:hypothetical protein GCM10017667_41290 [Streptomyces filamentosus]|uniref:Uncharacterized protein n=1 Tax=Streptomyces filamentosus TaxID=67294 RepID=A0A919EQ05_STRFL|nr:hypothetical protein GCM10017667_41290 [Streptomyces filamentosus]
MVNAIEEHATATRKTVFQRIERGFSSERGLGHERGFSGERRFCGERAAVMVRDPLQRRSL